MAVIEKDKLGLFVYAGGWKCRPVVESQFNAGERVVTYHFGGTIKAGIGKTPECGRGEYQEYWCTNGDSNLETKAPEELIPWMHAWYKELFFKEHSELVGDAQLTAEEKKMASEYMMKRTAKAPKVTWHN